MNETHEPSYYEIALTNRQVMVVFVVLLMSVIAAFLSGVWVGRGEPTERAVIAERLSPAAAAAGAGPEEREVRSLNFFTEEKREREPEAPLAKVVETPRQDTTLLEDVGGSAPPPIVEEEPVKEAPATAKKAPVERAPIVAKAPAPATPAPRVEPKPVDPPAATATDGFVVQVFSSGDQGQASRVRDKLRTSGYTAFLSPVDVNAQTMYRVRVGPYAARVEAETAANRVKRDFRYETWITR